MYIQIQNSYFKWQYSEMQTDENIARIGGMLHTQFILNIFALNALL